MSFNFQEVIGRLDKAVEYLKQDLGTLRTGKATPQLLDTVVVEAYGSHLKINEVASVAAPDPTMLLVTPWDKSILEAVAKAISVAQLNLNPVIDGDMIRIAVPALTEDRRKEMVKILNQKIESGRVMIRSIRNDAKKEIEKQEGEDDISEDDIKADLSKLEEHIKSTLEKLDDFGQKKEAELMKV